MENHALKKLYELIKAAKSGSLPIQEFCDRYEIIFNLELDKPSVPASELVPLAALFDRVVWFSPSPDERKRIPHYVGENEIVTALDAVDLTRYLETAQDR